MEQAPKGQMLGRCLHLVFTLSEPAHLRAHDLSGHVACRENLILIPIRVTDGSIIGLENAIDACGTSSIKLVTQAYDPFTNQ